MAKGNAQRNLSADGPIDRRKQKEGCNGVFRFTNKEGRAIEGALASLLVVARMSEQGQSCNMSLNLVPGGAELIGLLLERLHALTKNGGFVWFEGSDYASKV